MTMITPSYLGETIEYSSLHACRSTLEDPTGGVFYRPGWSRGDGFFGYFSEGGSVNDGKISTTNPARKSLGSHVLFKEGLDLGYQFNDVISLAAFVDHISNAGLANRNEGLTSAGMRVGYKF